LDDQAVKNKEFADLGRQLLPDLAGFQLKGKLLFSAPIGHTLRAILFDESSFDSRMFFVHVFAQPMFVPARHLVLNIGWRLDNGARWNADDSTLINRLLETVRSEAIPFLSRIRSPRDLVTEAMSLNKSQDPYVQQAVAYAFARIGDVRSAIDAIEHLVRLLKPNVGWQEEMLNRLEEMRRELFRAPSAVMKSLEGQEAETIANLGLRQFGQE
jgi:hypothetical protein